MFFKTYSTIFSRNNTKQYNHRPQRKSIFNEIMKRVKTSNKNKEKKLPANQAENKRKNIK